MVVAWRRITAMLLLLLLLRRRRLLFVRRLMWERSRRRVARRSVATRGRGHGRRVVVIHVSWLRLRVCARRWWGMSELWC